MILLSRRTLKCKISKRTAKGEGRRAKGSLPSLSCEGQYNICELDCQGNTPTTKNSLHLCNFPEARAFTTPVAGESLSRVMVAVDDGCIPQEEPLNSNVNARTRPSNEQWRPRGSPLLFACIPLRDLRRFRKELLLDCAFQFFLGQRTDCHHGLAGYRHKEE
jgi:hypothetical protein